jgi:uncharacterized iron-regulated protein
VVTVEVVVFYEDVDANVIGANIVEYEIANLARLDPELLDYVINNLTKPLACVSTG